MKELIRAVRYERETDSIRSVPENYCLAYRENGTWHAYTREGATRALRGRIARACYRHRRAGPVVIAAVITQAIQRRRRR